MKKYIWGFMNMAHQIEHLSPGLDSLFMPMHAIMFPEGHVAWQRIYPFGEIQEPESEGLASYVIYVTTSHWEIEQRFNMLRLTPASLWNLHDPQNFFMEITQIPNITVPDAAYKIKSERNISNINVYTLSPCLHTPDFYMVYRNPQRDSINLEISIRIKDNNHGGVFVITEQRYDTGGMFMMFTNFRRTLMTIH